MNKSELLEILAKNMNCFIVKWKNVDDAIKQNIEIFKLIDTNSYITDEEYERLKQKSFIGK